MTIEGIDEDDGCTGPCCAETGRRPTSPANAHRVRLLTLQPLLRHSRDTPPMDYPHTPAKEEPVTGLDQELAAMTTILDALNPLTPDERKAVIATVWEHYETRAIVAAVQVAEEQFGLFEDAT